MKDISLVPFTNTPNLSSLTVKLIYYNSIMVSVHFSSICMNRHVLNYLNIFPGKCSKLVSFLICFWMANQYLCTFLALCHTFVSPNSIYFFLWNAYTQECCYFLKTHYPCLLEQNIQLSLIYQFLLSYISK